MPVTALRTSAPLSVSVSSSTLSSSKTGETTMLEVQAHTQKTSRPSSMESRPEMLAGAIVIGVAAQAVLGPIAGLVGAAVGAFGANALTSLAARRPPSSNGSKPVNK